MNKLILIYRLSIIFWLSMLILKKFCEYSQKIPGTNFFIEAAIPGGEFKMGVL